jgi:hypothetical protein
MPELTHDDLVEAAKDPQTVTVDGQTVTAHNLKDLIALDKHIKGGASVEGGRSAWGRTRTARAVPPGAVGA